MRWSGRDSSDVAGGRQGATFQPEGEGSAPYQQQRHRQKPLSDKAFAGAGKLPR
jgi:hypothetical protein